MTKVRPTLFIGLGGTGMEVALRIRRCILSHAWGSVVTPVRLANLTEFPLAQFIQFDLDAYAASETRKNGTDPLTDMIKFTDAEKIVASLDLDKYFRTDGALNQYPHIASWFPWTRNRVLELGIRPSMGTGQLRWLSRLYFFDKYQHLKDMIQSKIAFLHDVSNRAKLERLGMAIEPMDLRIVVIASTAGGTGSGAFIDMGYLAKWLANMAVGRSAKVDLILMLPSAFSVSGKTRTEANTYAALMELETCMRQGVQFVKRWSESEAQELPSRPYDDVFLFDNGNLAMKKKAQVADLYDMVAEMLFGDFSPSDFSNCKLSIRECHKQYKVGSFFLPVDVQKYGSMKLRYSKAYSAFGQSIIKIQVEQHGQEIPHTQKDNKSLIKILEQMSSSERKDLFKNCLETAMPWVEANVSWVMPDNPTNQYICLVAVDGSELFKQKFGKEFNSVIPTYTGLTPYSIQFKEADVPGKLTCYVELSGIPLTALNQLPKWRESYYEENIKIPVHIHKDRTLFVHPLAPSAAALERLSEHFKLFIQGVALGVLKARVDDTGKRNYCLKIKGHERSVGNERLIRLDGLVPEYIHFLQRQITEALDLINTSVQYSGLIALYDFYAHCVYPPAIIRQDGMDDLEDGFGNVMCNLLRDDAVKALKGKYPDVDSDLMIVRLIDYENMETSDNLDALDLWTNEIKGSESDVYEYEVGKFHKAKRTLKPEFFQQGWIEEVWGMNSKEFTCTGCHKVIQKVFKFCPDCGAKLREMHGVEEVPFVKLDGHLMTGWWVALDNKADGPHNETSLENLVSLEKLSRTSLVWKEGMSGWAPAEQIEELNFLFTEICRLKLQ